MAKLEKTLNETIEEILAISPKITMAKIATMLGVSSRSITRSRAWGSRKKGQGQGGRKKKMMKNGNKKSDTPVARNLKKGLQGQAKFVGVVVHNTLKEYHNKPLTDNEMKDVIDAIYTALYSVNHYKNSSAEEFVRIHSHHIEEIEGESEFLEGFEG